MSIKITHLNLTLTNSSLNPIRSSQTKIKKNPLTFWYCPVISYVIISFSNFYPGPVYRPPFTFFFSFLSYTNSVLAGPVFVFLARPQARLFTLTFVHLEGILLLLPSEVSFREACPVHVIPNRRSGNRKKVVLFLVSLYRESNTNGCTSE